MQLFCKPGILHHRHYPHVSAVVFSLLAFTVLGVGFPMLLLAQSIQNPGGSAPMGSAPSGGQMGGPGPANQGYANPGGPSNGTPGGFSGGQNNGQPGGAGMANPSGFGGGPNNGQQGGQQGGSNMGPNQGFGGGPNNGTPGGRQNGQNMGPNQQNFGGPNQKQSGKGMQSSKGFGGGPNNGQQGGQQGGQGMGPNQGFGGPSGQMGGSEGEGMMNDDRGGFNGENGNDEGMSDKQQQQQEARQKQMEKQQLAQMKRGMKGMEQGISMFDKQIAKLTKQGISVPTECSDNLQKVKTIIAAVKAADSFEAVQEAGVEEIQDAMQSLDGCRQQLEMLARWPQTIKQLNGEIKRLESALKRDRSIIAKLAKQGIDLNEEYNAFAEAVNQLKSVRDEADSKMKSGDSEGAFSLLEEGFFGSMQDVWEKDRVIQTMSNLGRFTSDFKRSIADAKRTISSLKRQRVDTSTLEDILAQAQEKGAEVQGILKTKPIDEDAVMSALQELEDLRQQFDGARQELSGAQESRPWQEGPQQFKEIQSMDFGQFGFGGGQGQNQGPQ